MNNLILKLPSVHPTRRLYAASARLRAIGSAFTPSCANSNSSATRKLCWSKSGKPVGVFPTHDMAPRVSSHSNLVGKWANWEHFHELDRKGLMIMAR